MKQQQQQQHEGGGGKGSNTSPKPNSRGERMGEDKEKGKGPTSPEHPVAAAAAGSGPAVISIVISQPEEASSPGDKSPLKRAIAEKDDEEAAAGKKGVLPRSESDHEQCRVCQQQTDEPLINLGCRCRGELAKAHRTCIDIWFHTKGSNTCEICQYVAANVPSPEPQSSQGCISPLWIAFSILVGGLLLDVLISASLGVSALPVSIIIGILILLGLGTTLRLTLECCHEWRVRRNSHTSGTNVNPGYHPAV